MSKIKQSALSAGILALLVFGLVACGPAAPAEPTLDPNMIYTAAAQTVAAQLTAEAALNPTATLPPPATETPIPTLPLASPFPTLPLVGTANPAFTVAPLPGLATSTPALPSSPDKAQWIENFPLDGALVTAGAQFDVIWTVKNVGTTTWNTNYTARFFSGKNFAEKSSYRFRGDTAPNTEAQVIIDARAPSTPGEYFSWWKLTNDQGINFGDVTITIVVVGSTAQPTASLDKDAYCCEGGVPDPLHEAEQVCVNHFAAGNTCPP